MLQRKKLAVIAVMLTLAAAPTLAAEDEHSQHHPAGAPAAAAMPAPGTGDMKGGAMPGMDGGMPMMRMMGMMGPGGGMPMMRMMQGHVEGRLAFLKTELKITDAQMPLWNAVADAIRANAKDRMGMMEGMMGQGTTLPDRLAAHEKMMVAHLEALRKFKSAVDPLYAALSDDQKKTADELLMGPMGMM